eukprot:jgi/Hompol1/6731/HPOL_003598-RA
MIVAFADFADAASITVAQRNLLAATALAFPRSLAALSASHGASSSDSNDDIAFKQQWVLLDRSSPSAPPAASASAAAASGNGAPTSPIDTVIGDDDASEAVPLLNSGSDIAVCDWRMRSPSQLIAALAARTRGAVRDVGIPRERIGVCVTAAMAESLLQSDSESGSQDAGALAGLSTLVSLVVVQATDAAAAAIAERLAIAVQSKSKSNAAVTQMTVVTLLIDNNNNNNSDLASLASISSIYAKHAATQLQTAVPLSHLTLEEAASGTSGTSGWSVDVAAALASQLVSDRTDALYATLVADEHGTALGLCFSSPASIRAALSNRAGVYHSRRRGLWYKGRESGATQRLHRIDWDCDADALRFTVSQTAPGFCHKATRTCFGPASGIAHLAETLELRRSEQTPGSYTQRLFSDPALLRSKILEEAGELCDAVDHDDVAWEAADLIYFALVKCVASGVSLADVEKHLDLRAKKITRRPGNAKPQPQPQPQTQTQEQLSAPVAVPASVSIPTPALTPVTTSASTPVPPTVHAAIKEAPAVEPFTMRSYVKASLDQSSAASLLKRPIFKTDEIMARVKPIVADVRARGNAALLEYTAKFDGATMSFDDIVERAPFDPAKMRIDPNVKAAIDLAYDNIYKFHDAQLDRKPLVVETMPGVVCSRMVRPIHSVGLYVPGGTAVLPSSALMLGVPAKVAGCHEIVLATPPRKDGSIAPEILYVAAKVGATAVLKAGGAQAIAALAYGTETVPKVDKICGPGNQYVTAAKMIAQSDSTALLAIDMPAGPSELLVIADANADPRYVVSDLLSQAEHGVDSQVVLVAVGFKQSDCDAFQAELKRQAMALPRSAIVEVSLSKSYMLLVDTLDEAVAFSNEYGPEHLILNVDNAASLLDGIQSAGSVFVGAYSPESCGDYASGTNHTLPTYGYSRVYSGVNTNTYVKHITTQELTKEGLNRIGDCVTTLATLEELEAHRNAVAIRLSDLRR